MRGQNTITLMLAFIFLFTPQLLPPFFPQALASGSTPLNTRGHFLPEDVLAALRALDLIFIGEDFNLSPTVRAFI